MPLCCVPGCNSKLTPNGIKFHSLPQGLRNEQRRKLWEKNIGKTFNSKSYICERHFTPDQFEQNRQDGKKLLRWNAIPTIFPLRRPRRSARTPRGHQAATRSPPTFETPPPPSLPITVVRLKSDTADNQNYVHLQLDKQRILQIRQDTPSGYVPIAPKIEPSSLLSVPQIEIDGYKKEIQRHKDEICMANKRISSLTTNITFLLKEKRKINDCLLKIFNDDQMKCLLSNNNTSKGDDVNWGYKTVDKAADLFKTCGETGYRVVLENNLPYPSIQILQKLKPDLFK